MNNRQIRQQNLQIQAPNKIDIEQLVYPKIQGSQTERNVSIFQNKQMQEIYTKQPESQNDKIQSIQQKEVQQNPRFKHRSLHLQGQSNRQSFKQYIDIQEDGQNQENQSDIHNYSQQSNTLNKRLQNIKDNQKKVENSIKQSLTRSNSQKVLSKKQQFQMEQKIEDFNCSKGFSKNNWNKDKETDINDIQENNQNIKIKSPINQIVQLPMISSPRNSAIQNINNNLIHEQISQKQAGKRFLQKKESNILNNVEINDFKKLRYEIAFRELDQKTPKQIPKTTGPTIRRLDDDQKEIDSPYLKKILQKPSFCQQNMSSTNQQGISKPLGRNLRKKINFNTLEIFVKDLKINHIKEAKNLILSACILTNHGIMKNHLNEKLKYTCQNVFKIQKLNSITKKGSFIFDYMIFFEIDLENIQRNMGFQDLGNIYLVLDFKKSEDEEFGWFFFPLFNAHTLNIGEYSNALYLPKTQNKLPFDLKNLKTSENILQFSISSDNGNDNKRPYGISEYVKL